jgi:hypothetical protein
MSPILGIWASAVTGGLSTNSFESIATQTVGAGGTASITFSSIPATYTHLQIRFMVKDTDTSTNAQIPVNIRMNSDSTTSNYALHRFYGDGSTIVSSGFTNTYPFVRAWASSVSNVTNTFGVGIVDILDYANTNKYKTVRSIGGTETNSTGAVGISSGLWMSTNAINTLLLYSDNGNLAQYSHFALYGIKAAS